MTHSHEMRGGDTPYRAPAAGAAHLHPTSAAGTHSKLPVGRSLPSDARPTGSIVGASDNCAAGGNSPAAASLDPRVEKLRTLLGQGLHMTAAALAMGIPRSTARRIASLADLEVAPGTRRKYAPMTEAELRTALHLRAQGLTLREIGMRLGRVAKDIENKFYQLRAGMCALPEGCVMPHKGQTPDQARVKAFINIRLQQAKRAKYQKRTCLSCSKTFDSEWVGNRICPGCKLTEAWT